MLAAFLGGAVVTFAVTPLIALFSRRRGIVDLPGGRKAHAEPTPRMGGVAVFFGLVFGASAYAFAFGWDAFGRLLRGEDHAALFLACAIVLLVGVIDDWRGIAPVVRVLFEAMAAVILMEVGYLINAVWTPWGVVELGLFAYPLTILWIVAVTNSFNLIDGLDGLLPSVGIASLLGIAGVGLLVGMKGTVFLPLALAGALAGFLYWNWRPARVFLGDSGSLVVGFLAAAMALKVSRYIAGGVALHVMLALCAVPVVETLLTLARRYVGGQPYFSGDQSHAHHLLVRRKGLSVPRTVIVLAGLQALFSGMAVSSRMRLRWHSLIPVGALLLLVVVGVWWLGYVELRVFWHHVRHSLFGRRRRQLSGLVGMARAGELVRDVASAAELAGRLRDAVREGGLAYLALELSDAGAKTLAGEQPPAEARNDEAAAYLSGRDGKPTWLFSTEPAEAREGTENGGSPAASVTISVRLPAEDGRYGRLTCLRRDNLRDPGPCARDVHLYLAAPVARALERLERDAKREP
jgi:UDP-GlcNAc:undecaprenyl-phosphate GlcNAc-1-phosphate transferase